MALWPGPRDSGEHRPQQRVGLPGARCKSSAGPELADSVLVPSSRRRGPLRCALARPSPLVREPCSDERRSGVVVSRLLGHSDVRMTLRYAHFADKDIEAAAERIGEAMASGDGDRRARAGLLTRGCRSIGELVVDARRTRDSMEKVSGKPGAIQPDTNPPGENAWPASHHACRRASISRPRASNWAICSYRIRCTAPPTDGCRCRSPASKTARGRRCC